MIADAGPGTKVEMKINRNGDIKDLDFTLADRSDFVNVASNGDETTKQDTWLGLDVSTFTKSDADRQGLDFQEAVIVENVEPGSPADDAGMFRGDLILEINHERIKNKSDFSKVAKDLKERKKSILFLVKRGTRTIHKAIKPE